MTVANDERTGLSLPPSRYPTGWFQIGYLKDVEPGAVVPLKYFNQDLVLWRTKSGKLVLMDAHCLHLGAHIGVGGTVFDECIECPWHGWQYDETGQNVKIPYSEHGPRKNARIRTWRVREYYGTIQAWFDPAGREPFWELPAIPELETGEYYPLITRDSYMLNRVKMHCQNGPENMADAAHIHWVHGSGTIPVCKAWAQSDYSFRTEVTMIYGHGKEKTWLTPDGPVEALLETDAYGIGITIVRFVGMYPTVQLASFTPVDDQYTDYFFQQASQREPGDAGDIPQGQAAGMLRLQRTVIPQDFPLWENMKYSARPLFAPEEAAVYGGYRRWALKQYATTSDPSS
jgi:phenylpropionate dioxygenase-like ring-hydroxylating dioxygenase large terminal subunit